ncbi:hypothetical protein SCOCK_300024 [Actinacidiphila cocklensis]|uniref:Uncharacterized protein n=1 Tax=Actinacidiphila cocklensis TaxID=887465 RepID=A0A9W4E8B8_9ACTN|nr:hypothetical protein SCOCK_300024 [Actinacidiphila cocklensis]
MEAPAANRSAASNRIRSRNACRSGVSPPPCGYLIQTAYRDNHTLSACPQRHPSYKLSRGGRRRALRRRTVTGRFASLPRL